MMHMYPSKSGEFLSPLISSMLLLTESIESDSISSQFELVFRRKPGLSCEAAKLPDNISKNRYRDISPCKRTLGSSFGLAKMKTRLLVVFVMLSNISDDASRVILNSCPSGDYINANYVTMEIPVSGVVNRYIASQGPLSTTCIDFWIMIWETQSPLGKLTRQFNLLCSDGMQLRK